MHNYITGVIMSHTYTTISNAPSTRSRNINPFCFWEGAFTEEELSKILEIMKKIPSHNKSRSQPLSKMLPKRKI
jgi:hypothetical protein